MADDVTVTFGASIANLVSGVDQVKAKLEGLASFTSGLQGTFTEIGEALAAAFAVEAVEHFVEKMTELGVVLARTQALLGVPITSVAALGVTAQAAGGSLEGLTHSMERLGMALARADGGSKQAEAGLQALGLSAKNFSSLDTEHKLEVLAEKFSVLKDGTEKDAIAMALLSRSGAQMIPVFNQGAEAMREFAEMVDRAGTGGARNKDALDQFARAAHDLHLQGIELSQAWAGASETIFTEFQPALSGVYKILIDLVENFTNAIRQGGMLRDMFMMLTTACQAVATAIAAVIAVTESLWSIMTLAIDEIAHLWIGLGTVIKDVMSFNFSQMRADWAETTAAMGARAKQFTGEVETYGRQMVAQLKAIWQSGADEHHRIEQTKNAKLQMTNQDAVAAAIAAEQAKIKAADDAFKLESSRIDASFKLHQIGESEKTAALIAALNQRFTLEMAAVNDELKIHGMSKAQYQKALDEKLQLERNFQLERQKIIQQAMLEEQKTFMTIGTAITSSFNAQLRGLLAGTTTWKNAMKAMLGDLLIKAIEIVEKWGLEWAAGALARTVVDQTQATASAAAQVAGMEVTLPARIAKFTSDLTADAALVFAGVFANLAPLMGPAAAAPAGIAEASVFAQMAAVPKFETGTSYVPFTGLAVVHRGEAIIPASQNTVGASSVQNAGAVINISFTANGGMGASEIRQHARTIAQAVAEQFRNNPTLRPKY